MSRVAADLVTSSQFRRRPRFIAEEFAYMLENSRTGSCQLFFPMTLVRSCRRQRWLSLLPFAEFTALLH